MIADDPGLDTLVRINTEDFLAALGLGHVRRGRRFLELLCRRLARRFAREMLAYDAVVGERGLAAGGLWASSYYLERWSVEGQGRVPQNGPLLVVSNHPGLYDAALLFASIPRDDLLVIAAERPFLRALPNTSRHLLYAGGEHGRLVVVRAAAAHLRRQGAILTFPGGEIEPDPAFRPGEADRVASWTDSALIFARLAPDLAIVPAVVSGIHSAAAQRHPLTKLRRAQEDREWLGAMLQVVAKGLARVEPRVAFGEPVRVSAEGPPGGRQAAAEAWREVVRRERALIQAATYSLSVEPPNRRWLGFA